MTDLSISENQSHNITNIPCIINAKMKEPLEALSQGLLNLELLDSHFKA